MVNAIISASYNVAEDNLKDYLNEIVKSKENTFLEDLNIETIELYSRILISNSVAYITLKRCGYEPLRLSNKNDFSQIINFNTIEVISRLGLAISDISEVELREFLIQ